MSNKQQFSTRERKKSKDKNNYNIYSSKHIRIIENKQNQENKRSQENKQNQENKRNQENKENKN